MKRLVASALAFICSIVFTGVLTADTPTMKPGKSKTTKSTQTHHKKKGKKNSGGTTTQPPK